MTAVVMVGGIGFIAALILGISAVTFAVKMDPREKAVLDQLPGANCGACGYAGCAAFAHELTVNPATEMACPAVNEAAIKVLSEILERELGGGGALVAAVRCTGTPEQAANRYQYVGPRDCQAAQLIAGGSKACAFGCLGLGSCVEACPFAAIHMGEDGLPHVDKEVCVGCGKCLDACPRHIIQLVPAGSVACVACISQDPAKEMKTLCAVGCIKCGFCEQICPYDAITVSKTAAAFIDQERCRRCGLCIGVCPTGVIKLTVSPARVRVIEEKCKGCSICAQVCPVDAISGRPKAAYTVDTGRCIGCGICMAKCPSDAIERLDT